MPATLSKGRDGNTLTIVARCLARSLALVAIAFALVPVLTPARADVPVENIRFDNPDVHSTAIDAAKAVNNCDPVAPKLIQELKDHMGAPAGLSLADLAQLPDVIRIFEKDYKERCGRHHLPGGPNGATYAFHVRDTLDQIAKPQLDRARKACTEAEFDAALAELERIAQISDANANNTANPQHKLAYREDAKQLRRIAAELKPLKMAILEQNKKTDPRCKDPSQTGATGTPGTTAPGSPAVVPAVPAPNAPQGPKEVGSVTTPRYRPDAPMLIEGDRIGGGMIGGNINVPTFSAGAQFDSISAREVPILVSPRNLSSMGGQIEFQASLRSLLGTDAPSPFSQAAFYAQLRGYSFWGSERAQVPVGGNNVVFTYLFANPATNTTGVLAGNTGQRISIKTEGEALSLNAGLKWEGPRLNGNPNITTEVDLGAAYEYFDQGYKIAQKSLTFSDVSSFTKLRIDEHFLGPRFGIGLIADDGVFYGSARAFVAPGLLITDASARQRNLCGPCANPQDRSFTLERSFSDTQFSVQTGFNLKLGARITRSLSLEGSLNYEYASRAAYLRPPTTPSEQPVSLDYGSRSKLFGGVFLTYRWE